MFFKGWHGPLFLCGGLQGLKVEPQTLLDVSGAVPESVTDGLLAACHSITFGAVQAAITNAIADGWGVRHAPDRCTQCGTGRTSGS